MNGLPYGKLATIPEAWRQNERKITELIHATFRQCTLVESTIHFSTLVAAISVFPISDALRETFLVFDERHHLVNVTLSNIALEIRRQEILLDM